MPNAKRRKGNPLAVTLADPHATGLPRVHTTWNTKNWAKLLPQFENQAKHGWFIPFKSRSDPNLRKRQVINNYASCYEHSEVISKEINRWLAHPAKPITALSPEEAEDVNMATFIAPIVMVIKEKMHDDGTWYTKVRMCLDHSVLLNPLLDHLPCSFPSVDDAAQAMQQGDWLWKVDLSDWFLHFALRADIRKYACFRWAGVTYQCNTAGFGISAIPALAQEVIMAIGKLAEERMSALVDPEMAERESMIEREEWAAWHAPLTTPDPHLHHLSALPKLFHYIDDTLGICKSRRDGLLAMQIFVDLLDELGVAHNPDKQWGPFQTLTFLGIVFDSVNMELRIDEHRQKELKILVDKARPGKICLQSLFTLTGKLAFAAQVVKAGRPMLRKLFDNIRMHRARPRTTSIWLSRGAVKDLDWWKTAIHKFNGKSKLEKERVVLGTDACSWGCGGFWAYDTEAIQAARSFRQSNVDTYDQVREWAKNFNLELFHRPFTPDERHHITFLETLALVEQVEAHAQELSGKQVEAWTDATTALAAANTGASTSPEIAKLARRLHLTNASHDIELAAVHVPGIQHDLCDFNSRLCVRCQDRLGDKLSDGLCAACAIQIFGTKRVNTTRKRKREN